jgi:parallel beta-helix repeat protein
VFFKQWNFPCSVIVSFLVCLCMASLAHAASVTYYVSPSGNDGNTCAQAQNVSTPRKTFAAGVACLTSGDRLYLRAGTYAASPANAIPSGTSWSSATLIAAYPGETATIVAASSGTTLFYFAGPSYVILDGLVVDAASGHDGLKISSPSHHIRFTNGEIKNAANQGVLTGGPGGNEFLNCKIHHNGGRGPLGINYEHGMYLADNGGGRIERCDIYDNRAGFGIHGYGGTTSGYVIRNNRIWNNLRTGILLADFAQTLVANNLVWGNGGGIKVRDQNNRIYNNTVYGNQNYPGIWVMGAGHTLANNIVAYNTAGYGASGIYVEPGTASVQLRHNLVAHNTLVDGSGSALLAGNLLGDQYEPRFVNAAAADFHLLAASPAINAGLLLAEVPTDFEGTARPYGAAYDIGAYEYQAGAPIALTPPTNFSILIP